MKSKKKYSSVYFKLSLLAILNSNINLLQAQVDPNWVHQQAETSRNACEEANRNKAQLIADGKWTMNKMPGTVYLRTPIESMPNMHDYSSYHIPFCVDRLPNSTNYADFFATVNETYTHSYNGSTGTLFEYAQSGFNYMQSNPARVVAAANGIIVAKGDGNYDQNCAYTAGNGNYMIIEHSDGRRTGYYHLRNGLITPKTIGDYIYEGEPIGYPGGFHGAFQQLPVSANLFFELRDAGNNVIDPFGGIYGGIFPLYPSSWRDSTKMESLVGANELKYLKTMKHTPVANDNCGEPVYQYTDHFNPGDPFYIRYAITNYDSYNDSVMVNVFNPVGIPILPTHTRPAICPNNCGVYFDLITAIQYISYVLPTNQALMIPGTYTVVLNTPNRYNNTLKSYTHYFTVGCQANYSLSYTRNGEAGIIAGSTIDNYETCNSGSRVTYVAGNEVILHPGFNAYNGSNVMIYTEPCVVPPRLENDAVIDNSITELTIAPNPATDKLKLSLNSAIDRCEIFDAMGQLVFKTDAINQNDIDVSKLKPGIYLLTVLSQGKKLNARFVKM